MHARAMRRLEAVEAQRDFRWHAGCIVGVRPEDMRLRVNPSLSKGETMKRLIALALAATFALPSFALLSGCNTVEGAGKDIQAGGSKIKEEARENKKY